MSKKLLLIINLRAGKTQSRSPLFDAVSTLCQAGYLVNVHITAGRNDATLAAEELGGDYDVVACSGGDGTLNETVAGLMRLEKKPLLAYLPRGSTNDFAASLHISCNPVRAAAAIAADHRQVLDIGQWNDRYFVYVASFGAFTRSSYSVSQAAKNALGHFAYILEGMKDLSTLRPYRVKVTADGQVYDGEYLFGAVCNTTSIGGLMKFEPEHVVLDDGKFELLLVPNPSTPLGLQNLLLALMSQRYHDEGIVYCHASHITVQTEVELPWSLDGEYAPSVPLVEIDNRQGAVTMLL